MLRLKLNHSSTPDVSGVVGKLLLKADMLIGKGVGEHVCACTKWRLDRTYWWAGVLSS